VRIVAVILNDPLVNAHVACTSAERRFKETGEHVGWNVTQTDASSTGGSSHLAPADLRRLCPAEL
jgi:hypothetical protein